MLNTSDVMPDSYTSVIYDDDGNAVDKLLKHTTQLRWKEDVGSGLFFRKEKSYLTKSKTA